MRSASSGRSAAAGRTACRRTPARRSTSRLRCACSSTLPLNMTTGIAPAPYCSWIWRSISQPSTCGIITSSSTRSGFASSIAVEPLVGAAGLADGVALELEVDADELAHLVVVVDEQDERAGLRRAARAGAVEERLEVGAAVAAVAAGRVEGGHAALVGPFADRALRDAEEAGRLPERQPLAVVSGCAIARESGQSFRFLHHRRVTGLIVFVRCNRQIRASGCREGHAERDPEPRRGRPRRRADEPAGGGRRRRRFRSGAGAARSREVVDARRAGRRGTRRRATSARSRGQPGEGARSSTAARAQRSASR